MVSLRILVVGYAVAILAIFATCAGPPGEPEGRNPRVHGCDTYDPWMCEATKVA